MITIVSTSVGGKRKKVSLIENIFSGRRFEIGQKVATTERIGWIIGSNRKGKVVGFNLPNQNGIVNEVLKIIFEGEKTPRNLKTTDVQILKR